MDVALNFINNSNDVNNSEIVIFGKNLAAGDQDPAIAWLVIKSRGQGDSHSFVYPATFQVAGRDNWGNYTSRLNADSGQQFMVEDGPAGAVLRPSGQAAHVGGIEVINNLSTGAIRAMIYKSGKLYAQETDERHAVFAFQPTIWIGVASQVSEGEVMNSTAVSSVTELSLHGVASADIVWTGGGQGEGAKRFAFTLTNIVTV
jgi:hypothetical protein